MNYWKVAEYVSLVMDMVPELFMQKHRMQLDLGLRARVRTTMHSEIYCFIFEDAGNDRQLKIFELCCKHISILV